MSSRVLLFWNLTRFYADYRTTSRADAIGVSDDQYVSLASLTTVSFTVAEMRNALHLVLSFSPLLALVPKKLAGEGLRRDHMLAVRFMSSGDFV